MKGFSWVVERPAYGVFLKLHKRNGLGFPEKEPDDESDTSGATTSEKEGISKGKEPMPEPSGKSASVTTNPALDFQADTELYVCNDTSSRVS